MKLKQLEYFKRLAEYEHYTLAAQSLNITQSSLSKAIHSLEEELGVYLFEHVGRNVRLTRAGSRYLQSIRHSLEELNEATDRISREQAGSDGCLDIGLISSIENNEFVEWIRGFRAEYEGQLYYSCHTDTTSALIDGLKRGRFDLIFCTPAPWEQLLLFTPVCRQRIVIVVPEDHPFASRDEVDVRELDGISLVTHASGTGMWQIVEGLFSCMNIRFRSISEATDDRTLIALVRSGIAPAVMTDSPGIHMSGLKIVPLRNLPHEREVCIGRRRDIAPSEAAKQFYNYVVRHVDKTFAEE